MGCFDLALFRALLDFNGYSTLMYGCDPLKDRVLEELQYSCQFELDISSALAVSIKNYH